MCNQIAYNSNGYVIHILTNGNFSTSDDILYNRYQIGINEYIIIDIGKVQLISKLMIATGNALWGGYELPKSFFIEYSETICGPWIYLDEFQNINYGSLKNIFDKKNAKLKEFVFNKVSGRFFKIVFTEPCGENTIIIRQIKFIN